MEFQGTAEGCGGILCALLMIVLLRLHMLLGFL